MRWADLGPMPGRRPSSSTKLCTGPSYGEANGSRLTERAAEAAEIEAAGDGAHPLGLQLLSAPQPVTHGCDDEVLEHLDVVRIDDIARDRHRLELTGARHHRRDLPAAGG